MKNIINRFKQWFVRSSKYSGAGSRPPLQTVEQEKGEYVMVYSLDKNGRFTGEWEMNRLQYKTQRKAKAFLIYPVAEYNKVVTLHDMIGDQIAYFEALKKGVDSYLETLKKGTK